jgi:hypothetical protein
MTGEALQKKEAPRRSGARFIQELLRTRTDKGRDGRNVEPVGHAILGPDRELLYLPEFAFTKLDLLGLLMPERGDGGLRRISRSLYSMLDPAYESLTLGLRALLGPDVSGPDWLICSCKRCTRVQEDADRQSDAYWIRSRTA